MAMKTKTFSWDGPVDGFAKYDVYNGAAARHPANNVYINYKYNIQIRLQRARVNI